MENEFYNVTCKVCKQEYIINKSALNREMDGEDSYICPACRSYLSYLQIAWTEEKNNINPDHYGGSEIDVIDFCQVNNLDFMQGNVIKYITRYRKKNGLEDVRKAVEYINRILADEYPEYEAVVRTKGK